MRVFALLYMLSFTSLLYADEDVADSALDQNLSVGGALVTWSYEESGQVYSPISFEAVLDYHMFEPLEVSLRLGLGFGDAENDDDSSARTIGLDLYKLVYLKPYISWQGAQVYGLLGYADYDITSNPNVSSSGVSYGAGADYNLFDVSKVYFEWRRLPDTGVYDLSSISMGFTFPY